MRISHLRYNLYGKDSSVRIGLFVFNFEKFFSDLKNVSSISSGLLLFANLDKNFHDFQIEKRENCLKNLKSSPALQNFSKISTFSLGHKGCAYYEISAIQPTDHFFMSTCSKQEYLDIVPSLITLKVTSKIFISGSGIETGNFLKDLRI